MNIWGPDTWPRGPNKDKVGERWAPCDVSGSVTHHDTSATLWIFDWKESQFSVNTANRLLGIKITQTVNSNSSDHLK